jgi:hypothetical protein
MVQGKKMKTLRELYLQCLDEDMRETSIPRICYTFSMDARKKAAQATINFFMKPNVKFGFTVKTSVFDDGDD